MLSPGPTGRRRSRLVPFRPGAGADTRADVFGGAAVAHGAMQLIQHRLDCGGLVGGFQPHVHGDLIPCHTLSVPRASDVIGWGVPARTVRFRQRGSIPQVRAAAWWHSPGGAGRVLPRHVPHVHVRTPVTAVVDLTVSDPPLDSFKLPVTALTAGGGMHGLVAGLLGVRGRGVPVTSWHSTRLTPDRR